MHLRTTQVFRIDVFVDRHFHDGWTTQVNRRIAAHHHHFIGQRGNVRSTGGGHTEHGGNLGQALGRQVALAEENIAEVITIREHPIPLMQIGATAIHQIDARQLMLLGNFLGTDMLLHRFRIIGAALHSGIVGDDDTELAVHHADSGDDAGAVHLAAVLLVCSQRGKFQERCARVHQQVDALAGQQFAPLAMTLDQMIAAAVDGVVDAFPQLVRQFGMVSEVGFINVAVLVHRRIDFTHDDFSIISCGPCLPSKDHGSVCG